MLKAIERMCFISNLNYNAEYVEISANGNLHKAMNILQLNRGKFKVKNSHDDYEFTFFHTLGKFLYNKSNQKIGIDSNGKVRMMQFYELLDPVRKPKLYFDPEDIINRASCEQSNFWLFLEENFLDFFEKLNFEKILQILLTRKFSTKFFVSLRIFAQNCLQI